MKYLKYLVISLLISIVISAQPQANLSSAEILQGLKKLNNLGSVLYIAAHPDDENTSLLAYFAKGKLFRTGYLSLTRGDGGQNLIGPEQSELLGVIRTQELLEARKRDGAEQFFSRAIDFGYSKSPEETFTKWDKQKILYDVVWVIRNFKPDVIITRFPTTGEGRHGHHTASAILALEGFRLAGDKNASPEQLEFTDTWQPKRIYWNAWMPILESKGVDPESLPSINLGEYNSLLGKSYTEISAISRSMHKSQGFGSSGNRTNNYNYFELMDGSPATKDLFEGIDVSWNRVDGGKKVGELISTVTKKFDPENPAVIIPDLISIKKEIQSLSDGYWKNLKLKEVDNLIKNCAGIWIEAIANSEVVSVGDTLKINSMIVNRSDFPFEISSVELQGTGIVKNQNLMLENGEANNSEFIFNVPIDFPYTQKFWLVNKHQAGMYNFDAMAEIGKADSDPSLTVKFILKSDDEVIELSIPVFYRYTDPVKGEVYKSLIVAPPATINLDKEIYYFKNGEEKEIRLNVIANRNNLIGKLNLIAENGWRILPDNFAVSIDKKGDQQVFLVKVIPGTEENSSLLSASINVDGKTFAKSKTKIEYDHILAQTVFHPSEAKLVALNYKSEGVKKIGYISGSGDVIPDFLKDLGYEVSQLSDEDISANNLKLYDVIITGIRAFNTRDKLKSFGKELNEYVNQGGVLISQYNTTGDLVAEPGPLMLNISRDRVTDENALVKILDKSNPIINFPFKITDANFENWVQERGLYFADKWDSKFTPLFEMNDPGESQKQGSLLFAKYGKGIFIYTGLSFFRQVPAGVTGAIKLFINMLYSGVYEK